MHLLNIKKLHPDAVIPQYQTGSSSGFDLHALEDYIVYPGETVLIRTGLAFEIPSYAEVQIRPRSGLSLKTPLRINNAPGTIDADFKGEVCIIMSNVTSQDDNLGWIINKGDRIAQGVLCPVYKALIKEVSELTETTRGSGGFGHTGK